MAESVEHVTPLQRELDEVGYVTLENVISGQELAAFRDRVEALFQVEGDRAGSEFKQESGARRLANLVNKGRVFQDIVAQARVIECVRCVLGDQFKLSSVNARSANPHTVDPQPLHCDMGAVPDSAGYWVCNAVWLLDDFTSRNGTLRVVPGSHKWHKLPHAELSDPRAPHPDEVLLTASAGSVIVMNAHLWHGGTGNRTEKPRTAVHAFYCRRDKPQQQYQKGLLDRVVQDGMSAELRELLALDDPRNDELSRSQTPRSGFLN